MTDTLLTHHTAVVNDVRLHYVTAREMVNILHAAEDGHSGDPGKFRDYRYRSLIDREERAHLTR